MCITPLQENALNLIRAYEAAAAREAHLAEELESYDLRNLCQPCEGGGFMDQWLSSGKSKANTAPQTKLKSGRPSKASVEKRASEEQRGSDFMRSWGTEGTSDAAAASTAACSSSSERDALAQRLREAEQLREAEMEAATAAAQAAAQAKEAAESVAVLVQQADAALAGAEQVAKPPRGHLPMLGEPASMGRLGHLSLSVTPVNDQRYEFSGKYSLYVCVAVPVMTAGQVSDWRAVSDKRTYTSAGGLPEACSADAEREVQRMAWKLMRPHLPREKATRKRKAPTVDTMPRRASFRLATGGAGGEAASDNRCSNGGVRRSGPAPKQQGEGRGHGRPAANSQLFVPDREQPPTAQLALLAAAQQAVGRLKLQLAQAATALEGSRAEVAQLKHDLAKMQTWAITTLIDESDQVPHPQRLDDIVGSGYTPTERARTFYNHFHRAFDSVVSITGGDLK